MFQPANNVTSTANFTVSAASLNQYGNILASRSETNTLVAQSADPTHLPDVIASFPLILRVSRKTDRLRVIIELEDGGRIGSAELDHKTLDSAPVTATPRPQLEHRSPTPNSTSLR